MIDYFIIWKVVDITWATLEKEISTDFMEKLMASDPCLTCVNTFMHPYHKLFTYELCFCDIHRMLHGEEPITMTTSHQIESAHNGMNGQGWYF